MLSEEEQREQEREKRQEERKQERLQKKIEKRRKLEERERKSVKRASVFELEMMIFISNKIREVLEKSTEENAKFNEILAKSLVDLRKFTKKESKSLKKDVINESKKDFEENKNGTLELIQEATRKKMDGSLAKHIAYVNPQKDTAKRWKKYIKTSANTYAIGKDKLPTFFAKLVQEEVKNVVGGKCTIDDSCRKAISKLADSGVKSVEYDTGVKRNVDVWVRQQMQYAEKESSQEINNKCAKDIGVTVFEFDAHANARPSHKKWQGKRYDTQGKLYPSLYQLTHGEEKDYGCRHFAQPVWDVDMPYAYTKEQLKNIDTKPFTFQGKKYEGYGARQYQRELERNIRALKREVILLDNQGLSSTETKIKLKHANATYKAFSSEMGDRVHNDRLRIG